jgi:hypothetical protein
MGTIRGQYREYCAFVPPKMRKDFRFLNLFEIEAWANNTNVLNRAMTTIKVKDIAQRNSQNCVQGLAQMKQKINPKPRKIKPKIGTKKNSEKAGF